MLNRRFRLALVAALVAGVLPTAPSLGLPDLEAGATSTVGAGEAPTMSTIAGGRVQNALATAVSAHPAGVAYDSAGNLYFGDVTAGLLWQVTPEGRASVVAGDGRACWMLNRTLGVECLDGTEGAVAEPAQAAYMADASALAVGPDGHVYFSEPTRHRIRRLDLATRTVETVAGSGASGYDPEDEGVDALDAPLSSPQAIAFDREGSLHIADSGNSRVRRVGADGTITTVAGCLAQCTSPILRDRSPVIGTSLPRVSVIAFDPDGVLVLAMPTAIYRADPVTGQWRRVAGDSFAAAQRPDEGEGSTATRARFTDISAVAFDQAGDLLVLDRAWHRIRRLRAPLGPDSLVEHVAGCSCGAGFDGDGGPAVEAQFSVTAPEPARAWIAVAPDGALALGDLANHRVRAIENGVVETVAGSGRTAPANRVPMEADYQPGMYGSRPAVMGGFSGDGGPATAAQLYAPADVVADTEGNLYVLDRYAHRVRRVDGRTGEITTVVGRGCAGLGCTPSSSVTEHVPATQADLYGPVALTLDKTGTQLLVADRRHWRIRQVNLGDTPVTVYPGSSRAITIAPGHIATVVGSGGDCVGWFVYCGDGRFALDAAVDEVEGLAFDAAGNLYFSDAYVNVVRRVDVATGSVSTVLGVPLTRECEGRGQEGQPGALTRLCVPSDLTVGPDGALYVAEVGDFSLGNGYIPEPHTARIRRVDLSDSLHPSTIVAGTGTPGMSGDGGPAREARLRTPHGLAFGPDGALYIADTGNSRIRRVAGDGTITTVAGFGDFDGAQLVDCTDLGDGGPAINAGLCAPLGITFAPDGTLYVADHVNNAVRAIRGL